MASGRLQWQFELVDRMSGPAGRMQKMTLRLNTSMVRLQTQGPRLAASLRGFGSSLSSLSSRFISATNAASQFALKMASMGGAAATGLGALGVKTALEAVTFKQNSMVAFEAMLGSKEQAKLYLDEAVKFADVTPFETDQVINAFQQLRAAGFTELEDIKGTLLGIGDLAAMRGMDKTVMDRVILAVGQIKSAGKLEGDELRQLTEAGINTTAVYEAIAKEMKKSVSQVRALKESGKLPADWATFGVLESIRQSLDSGKQLGGLMNAQAETIGGIMSTIKGRAFTMFADLDETAGMGQFKGFLVNLRSALDPGGPEGKRIKGALMGLFDSIFGSVGSLSGEGGTRAIGDFIVGAINTFRTGFETVKEIVTTAYVSIRDYFRELGGGDAANGVKEFFKKFQQTIADIGSLIGPLVDGLKAAVGVAEKVGLLPSQSSKEKPHTAVGNVVPLIDYLPSNFLAAPATAWLSSQLFGEKEKKQAEVAGQSIGKATADGYVNGLTQGQDAVHAASTQMAEVSKSGMTTPLQVKSPSKVFEYFGIMTGEGYAKGLEKSEGRVLEASELGLSPPRPVPTAQRGSSAGTVNLTINVQATSSPQETAKAVKEQVLLLFERLGLEMGVIGPTPEEA